MDTLFIFALVFLIACFVFRKKLSVFMTDRRERKRNASSLPMHPAADRETTAYKVLAYNAKDYGSTKDLENMMELRLEQCLAGLAKQGHKAQVEFHATGFVLVYLVKYTY